MSDIVKYITLGSWAWTYERFTRDIMLRENFDPKILPKYARFLSMSFE